MHGCFQVLILTLKRSAPNVLRFVVVAGVFYVGFCFCGWVVFGPYHIKVSVVLPLITIVNNIVSIVSHEHSSAGQRWMLLPVHSISYLNLTKNASIPQEPALNTWDHDDVIKWKHFPRYWPFVRGIHRSPVNSPHKGQWRGALMLLLISVCINGWVNNRDAGDLRRPLWRHRNVEKKM